MRQELPVIEREVIGPDQRYTRFSKTRSSSVFQQPKRVAWI